MTANRDQLNEELWSALHNFVDHISGQLWDRWDSWMTKNENRNSHEVIGGLLSRQVNLTSELAGNPGIWNSNMAPLVLRSMVEALITLAWILEDPRSRSESFILYGLGQEKLKLENQKALLIEEGFDPNEDPDIQEWEQWLNAQRYTELTEVNIGDWAGISLRARAEESGQLDLHRNDYARWSGAVHNMWHHLVRFNLQHCQNPLHGFHRVPLLPRLGVDPYYLQCAARYLDLTFTLFDEKTGVKVDGPSAVEFLHQELERIPIPEDGQEQGPSGAS
jgi:hypothetical protein